MTGDVTLGGLRRLQNPVFRNLTVLGTLDAPNLNQTAITTTAITTIGAGVLTAAALVGGQIVRTGPVAAYSDTTDTAANIVAAITNYQVGQTFFIRIKNATAFTQTIVAGTGITLPPTVIIPAFSVGTYYAKIDSATGITLTHMGSVPIASSTYLTAPSLTTISTVGAGTITAASFLSGYTLRSGSQSATPFTDTTDTAANIIAALPNLVNKIGTAQIYVYGNTTNAIATITGGTGVTVSGVTSIPAGMVAQFLVSYTAAATLTMVGIGVTNTVATAMAFAGSTSGQTIIQPTAIAAGTLTLPAVTGTVASTTGSNLYVADVKRCTASVTANATITYANVTGLSFTVVPGTYTFDLYLPSTVASGTGGIKYAFNYTTTVLSAIQASGAGMTSAAVACQQTTTTTTQTDIFTQAAVVLLTLIKGSMIVTTGGTIDVQMAQNTSNASNTVALINGWGRFTRIA